MRRMRCASPCWKDGSSIFCRTSIKKEFPGLRVDGEMFDGDPALVSFFQGGRKQYDGIDSGVDSLFDFPSYFVARKVFAQGAPIKDLAAMVGHDWLYPSPDVLV